MAITPITHSPLQPIPQNPNSPTLTHKLWSPSTTDTPLPPIKELPSHWQPYSSKEEAKQYDLYACIQRQWAGDILKYLWFDQKKVVDVGCGDGEITSAIAASPFLVRPKEIVGIDVCPAMIDYAKQSKAIDRLSFKVGEGATFTEQADVFLLLNVLHWSSDPEAILRNVYKNLTPGGTVIILAPEKGPETLFGKALFQLLNKTEWKDQFSLLPKIDYAKQMFSKTELEECLKKIGFHDVKVTSKETNHDFYEVDDLKEWFRASLTAVKRLPFYLRTPFVEDLTKTYLGFFPSDIDPIPFKSYKLEAFATK